MLLPLAVMGLGLRTAMPTIGVLPANASARIGYERLQQAFGPGAPRELQVIAPTSESDRVLAALHATPGVAAVQAPQRHGRFALTRVLPAIRAQ